MAKRKRHRKSRASSAPDQGELPEAATSGEVVDTAASRPRWCSTSWRQRGRALGFIRRHRHRRRNLLNLSTYYEMKERAGLVGVALGAVLARFGKTGPKLHLIGHSFGGRVVAAAVNALPGTDTPVQTLALLQAAFSHYGFAQKYDNTHDGAFRAALVQQVVRGPILITCTANDKAVGVAYPLASRVARQVGSAFGNADDRFGGLGRNGAQKTPEAGPETPLQPVGGVYSFQPGRVFNLRADAFIAQHSDITGPQVAYGLLVAIAGT